MSLSSEGFLNRNHILCRPSLKFLKRDTGSCDFHSVILFQPSTFNFPERDWPITLEAARQHIRASKQLKDFMLLSIFKILWYSLNTTGHIIVHDRPKSS